MSQELLRGPGDRRSTTYAAVTGFFLCSTIAGPVLAQANSPEETEGRSDRLTVGKILDWETVSDPRISPDGSQIVFTRRWVNQMEDEWASALWIMRADGSRQRLLAKGSSARWSPDGTRVAYLAPDEDKKTQIFVRWMDGEGAMWGYERYEGYPWTNPEKYLEHSPLMYVGNVTTPTVIMTGELDLRTPMSQSEEYYQALRAEGVPAVLLRFDEEYHGTSSKPANFMRTQLYLMSWFERWGTFDDGERENVAEVN